MAVHIVDCVALEGADVDE